MVNASTLAKRPLRNVALALVFGSVMLAAGPVSLAKSEELSPIEKGSELVNRLCARCHAVGQDDNSPMGEAPPLRTFVSKWPLESLEEAFAEGIVVGHPAMPEFMFEPNDIQNLLIYIDSLSR